MQCSNGRACGRQGSPGTVRRELESGALRGLRGPAVAAAHQRPPLLENLGAGTPGRTAGHQSNVPGNNTRLQPLCYQHQHGRSTCPYVSFLDCCSHMFTIFSLAFSFAQEQPAITGRMDGSVASARDDAQGNGAQVASDVINSELFVTTGSGFVDRTGEGPGTRLGTHPHVAAARPAAAAASYCRLSIRTARGPASDGPSAATRGCQ